MKRIIKNRMYDTDTAKLLATASCSTCSPSDFSYWTEELYRKRNGEFFIYGVGGPSSRYSRRIETNVWTGDSRIVPISYDTAREWAERELSADEYIRLFGEPDEGDGNEIMTLSLPAAVARRIRDEASRTGATISATVAGKFS